MDGLPPHDIYLPFGVTDRDVDRANTDAEDEFQEWLEERGFRYLYLLDCQVFRCDRCGGELAFSQHARLRIVKAEVEAHRCAATE